MNGATPETDYFPVYRNINGYYAFHLFSNMSFWLAIYAVFFLERGLTYSEILILYAVLNGVQTVLEIPSGALADRLGRRPVLMLGALLQASGNLLIAFGGGLVYYLAGMALCGLALAFISGSDAAFIFDTLTITGREREFKKIEGRAYMYNLLGWGTAGLLGGFLAARSLAIPFVLTAVASFLAFLVMAICLEPPRRHRDRDIGVRPARHLIADALKFIHKNKAVGAAILFSAVLIGTLLVKHKFSQPYLQAAGVDLKYFGVVYFVWLIGAALSSNFSEKIEAALGHRLYFLTLPVFTGLAMVYIGLYQNWGGVALLLLHQYAWGSLRPQVNDIINREAPAAIRATVLSFVGFGSSLVYIIGVPIFGYLADAFAFTTSLIWLGGTTILIGILAAVYLVVHVPGDVTE